MTKPKGKYKLWTCSSQSERRCRNSSNTSSCPQSSLNSGFEKSQRVGWLTIQSEKSPITEWDDSPYKGCRRENFLLQAPPLPDDWEQGEGGGGGQLSMETSYYWSNLREVYYGQNTILCWCALPKQLRSLVGHFCNWKSRLQCRQCRLQRGLSATVSHCFFCCCRPVRFVQAGVPAASLISWFKT